MELLTPVPLGLPSQQFYPMSPSLPNFTEQSAEKSCRHHQWVYTFDLHGRPANKKASVSQWTYDKDQVFGNEMLWREKSNPHMFKTGTLLWGDSSPLIGTSEAKDLVTFYVICHVFTILLNKWQKGKFYLCIFAVVLLLSFIDVKEKSLNLWLHFTALYSYT